MNMYKLIDGQLFQVTEVVTPKQTALVTTMVAIVAGHSVGDVSVDFETMPIKEEKEGFTAELHYTDGNLVWVYTPSITTESRVYKLETETESIKVALAEIADIVAGGNVNG